MVLTAERARARLYSISGCRFIAIEVKRVFVPCVKSIDMKQRSVIKFYFKSGKTTIEVYSDLNNVYGDE
jgi:hypothetical protein